MIEEAPRWWRDACFQFNQLGTVMMEPLVGFLSTGRAMVIPNLSGDVFHGLPIRRYVL